MKPKLERWQRALLMARRAPLSLLAVFRQARALNPDIIYTSTQRYDLYLGHLLSRLLGKPHVVHLNYPVGAWLGRLAVPILRRTGHLVSCSEFIKQSAVDQGVEGSQITVIHNATDLEPFTRGVDADYAAHSLGLDPNTAIVLSVGRLDPSKGHMELIEAFGAVAEDFPLSHLVLCGVTSTRDAYDQQLRQRVEDLQLGERVTFAGFRTDVAELMQSSDIFALPTISEAFGLVFTEAMASGLPVIAADSGGVPEIVLNGSTGYLSAPGAIDSLAEDLRLLLADEGRRETLGQAGRKRALSSFDPDRLAFEWVEEVLRILSTER